MAKNKIHSILLGIGFYFMISLVLQIVLQMEQQTSSLISLVLGSLIALGYYLFQRKEEMTREPLMDERLVSISHKSSTITLALLFVGIFFVLLLPNFLNPDQAQVLRLVVINGVILYFIVNIIIENLN